MDLDEFVATAPQTRRGYVGVMDRIAPEHKAQAIEGYAKGYTGKTIRLWLESLYPEMSFTPASVDGWLAKNHPRRTHG